MIAIYYLHVSQENKIQTIAASRDTSTYCYENVWLPKNMHLEKQPFKNHNAKTNYNSINNTITSFKVSQMLLTWPD